MLICVALFWMDKKALNKKASEVDYLFKTYGLLESDAKNERDITQFEEIYSIISINIRSSPFLERLRGRVNLKLN